MRYIYAEEEIDFLKNNCKGINSTELMEKFNSRFDLDLPIDKIKSAKQRYNLKSGVNTGLWKKGHIPWHKGTKGLAPAPPQAFKQGNITWNTHPVFFEQVNSCGYIKIKIAEPNKWISKHKYIYEQKYGEVPKDCVVIFADGDKRNFDVDNLILVAKRETMVMNSFGLRNQNPEITKTGLTLVKMIMKTRKLKNIKRKQIKWTNTT